MTDGIYLEGEDGLVELSEFDYSSEYEHVLQEYVAEYPHLLCGGQMTPETPREWLFVGREVSIPKRETGGKEWSVDHLFLDQDGVPTLVEVKRGVDTRIRREVVGQMLDYVSGARAFWDDDHLRELYEERVDDADTRLRAHLGEDVDRYWQDVAQNVRLGRVRMVFLADQIPSELKRIVEFLNEQLDTAEALAVEVKQYSEGGTGEAARTVFAPRLFGQTEQARRSSRSTSRSGDEYVETPEELFEDVAAKRSAGEVSDAVADAFLELYEFADGLGDVEVNSAKNASFKLCVTEHQGESSGNPGVFAFNINSKLHIWPASMPLPDDENAPVTDVAWEREDWEAYRAAFNELDGVEDSTSARPELLTRGDNLERFERAVKSFVDRCVTAASEESSR